MIEPIERSAPGTEFTTMTATDEALGGLIPVAGVTVTENGIEEWTGMFMTPDDDEETNE